MIFAAGVVVGVLGSTFLAAITAVVIGRIADAREDQVAVDLWTGPWPPDGPTPVRPSTPTPAEQAAGVLTDDLAKRREGRR